MADSSGLPTTCRPASSSCSRSRSIPWWRVRPWTGRAKRRRHQVGVEGALERSVTLAAAMDSRGYGRRGSVPTRQRRIASTALLAGLAAACVGAYGLVSTGSPALLGLPMLVIGVLATVYGVALAGRRSIRTRYRPDPWRLAEWLVLLAGVGTALLFAGASWLGVPGMDTPVDPPAWPTLPLIALLGVALAMTPAWTTSRTRVDRESRPPSTRSRVADAANGFLSGTGTGWVEAMAEPPTDWPISSLALRQMSTQRPRSRRIGCVCAGAFSGAIEISLRLSRRFLLCQWTLPT